MRRVPLGGVVVLVCMVVILGLGYFSRFSSPECRHPVSPWHVSLADKARASPMPVCAEGVESYQKVGLVDLSMDHLLRSSDLCQLNRSRPGDFRDPCELHRMAVLYYWAALTLSSQNLTWWLNAGSVLGALRSGGIMPHDKDGDLYVLITSEAELLGLHEAMRLISSYAPNMFYSTHCPRAPNSSCTCECRFKMRKPSEKCPSFACLSIPSSHAYWILYLDAVGHIDVVVCTPHPSLVDRIWCNGNPPAHDILRTDVLPLIQCNFHGQAFPCPRQPGRYLTHLPDFVSGDIQRTNNPAMASWSNPLSSYTSTCLRRTGWPSVSGCHNKEDCIPIGEEVQRNFEYDTPWFPYGPQTGINSSFIYNGSSKG